MNNYLYYKGQSERLVSAQLFSGWMFNLVRGQGLRPAATYFPSCETRKLLWMVCGSEIFHGIDSEMTDREGRSCDAACATCLYVFVCNV